MAASAVQTATTIEAATSKREPGGRCGQDGSGDSNPRILTMPADFAEVEELGSAAQLEALLTNT
ncbi:MAG: hypothetical protein ACRD6W_19665, partial [Nitrososphaerales archaeon]